MSVHFLDNISLYHTIISYNLGQLLIGIYLLVKKSAMKIIIVDKMSRFTTRQIKALQKKGEVMFTSMDKNSLQKLPKSIYTKEVVLMPDPDVFGWSLGETELGLFSNIKAICLPTTSTEWVDLDYCKKHNIAVTNTPQYSTEAVAEYAIWMMLSVARKLPLMLNGKMKDFSNDALQTEVKGKVMGVIGLGNIGRRIAEHGDRMGMKVIYWSRSPKDTFFEKVSLNKLLKTADFILPAFATNDETIKLLTKERLSLIKPSSHFISIIGNNRAIKIHHLLKMVNAKKLAGLAFEAELQHRKNYKGNVFTPPPFAWFSKESLDRCYEMLTETIVSVIRNQ